MPQTLRTFKFQPTPDHLGCLSPCGVPCFTHTHTHRVIHIRWTCTVFSHTPALIHRATHIKFIYTPLTATHTLSLGRTLTHNHSYTHKLTDTLTGCVRQTDEPIMSKCALAGDPRLLWAGLCALDECRGCHPASRLLDPSCPLCYLQSQINAPQLSFYTFPHATTLNASFATTGQFPVSATCHPIRWMIPFFN